MAQEVEAKFAVDHLADLRREIIKLGGRVLRDRTLERNWRYDRADGTLTIQSHVLRLRQDDRTTLTYKQPGPDRLVRDEIELAIEDVEAAHEFLQALGFKVIAIYEKYREVLLLDEVNIALDELPFGSFVELEDGSSAALRAAAERLGLSWQQRVSQSYLELFDRVAADLGLSARQATFEAFADLPRVTPQQLGLPDARRTAGSAAG